MKTYLDILKLNQRKSATYCDNQFCENEAFTKVRVSVHRTGDSVRHFCAPCAEAYTIGVQHGTFRTRTELKAEQAAKRPNTRRRLDDAN